MSAMTTSAVPVEAIIKPCPACFVSELYLTIFKEKYPYTDKIYSVECEKCGVRGPKSISVSDAIRRWNKLPRRYDRCPDYKVSEDEPEV